jgi:hypothetical protein
MNKLLRHIQKERRIRKCQVLSLIERRKKWKGMIKLTMMMERNPKRVQHPCGSMWQSLREGKGAKPLNLHFVVVIQLT